MNKLNFISGLPRAGSTLLAAILRQNPRFTASFRSPLEDMLRRQVRAASGEFSSLLADRNTDICRAMVEAYYKDADVAFDTNRAWMLRDSLTEQLFPDHKMILCVRGVIDILNSFEKLHKRNPMMLTGMYDESHDRDVFTRCTALMSDEGSVLAPHKALQQYLAATNITPMIVEYNDLVSNPKGTLKAIYKYLGEADFAHDFDNVEQIPGAKEYDMEMKTPGLHSVRHEVYKEDSKMLLPQTIIDGITKQMPNMEFWRK